MIGCPAATMDARIRRRLKLRDLDTLAAVARHGSMAKAAVQLAVSQPAVSKAVAEIEHILGVRLFDRAAQGVEPTPYGQVMLKWVAAVFDDLRQGVKEIEFLSDPTAGEVRVGAIEPMLGGFLAEVLKRVNRRFPRISFDVTQPVSLAQQRRELRERRVDLIVGRLAGDNLSDDIASEVLFEEPWSIVVGPTNPLLKRRKLNLADLLEQRWSLPPTDTVVSTYLARAFRSAGLEPPRSVVTCASIQMHYALMADGPFLAIFPRSLLRFGGYRMRLKVLPVHLPGPPPPVGITTLKKRTRSPVVDLFIAQAREIATQLQD